MAHHGNWSEEKRTSTGKETAFGQRCRQINNLAAWELAAIARCRACRRGWELNLSALQADGLGDEDVSWGKTNFKCPSCFALFPEVKVQWDRDHLLIDPPRGWKPPIPLEVLEARRHSELFAKTPTELAAMRLLTMRIADHHNWEVMAFCDYCNFMRSARGTWKKATADRNLIDALEARKLVCFKCHRPTTKLRVGKHWSSGGFEQIMTISVGARIDVHTEGPRYPEKLPPNLGPER